MTSIHPLTRLIDTILLFKCEDSQCLTSSRINASGYHISWASDRDVKFQNPTSNTSNLCDATAFATGVKVN